MCDLTEEEFTEYVRWLEATAARVATPTRARRESDAVLHKPDHLLAEPVAASA
jgi:hypothetical protein